MRKIWIIVSVVGVAAVGGGAYLRFKPKPQVDSVTKTAVFGASDVKVKQKSDLYLPTKLPEGYEINQDSVTSPEGTQEVVLIELASKSAPSIFISQQALPKDFSDKRFLSEMKEKEDFDVPAGRASIGKINDGATLMISISNDKRWIIINGPSQIPKESFKLIAEGLAK